MQAEGGSTSESVRAENDSGQVADTTQHKDTKLKEGDPKPKRKYSGWSLAEIESFFQGVATYGCDFERLSKAGGLNKTYEQIRHYYYRLIKRINAVLREVGKSVNKADKVEVRDALLCYYQELKKTGQVSSPPQKGTFEKELATALVRTLQNRAKVPHPSSPIKILPQPTFAAPAPLKPSIQNHSSPSRTNMQSKPVPKRLTLQLLPHDAPIANAISRHGHNPYLQLTFSSRKSIAYIVRHMTKKWVFELNGAKVGIAPKPIILYPTDIPQHNGWSMDDVNTSSAYVWTLLGCPSVMRLYYTWNPRPDVSAYLLNAAPFTVASAPLIPSLPTIQPKPPASSVAAKTIHTMDLSQQQGYSIQSARVSSTQFAPAATLPNSNAVLSTPSSSSSTVASSAAVVASFSSSTSSKQEEEITRRLDVDQLLSKSNDDSLNAKTTPTNSLDGLPTDFSGIELLTRLPPEIRFTSSSNDATDSAFVVHNFSSPTGLTPTNSPSTPNSKRDRPLSSSPSSATNQISPSALLSPGSTSTSPKFFLRTPETPSVLSLSFLGDDASRDGFRSLGDSEEKECHEYYQEFESASRDSNFEKFFNSSSPLFCSKRLDFGGDDDGRKKAGVKRRFHEATTTPSPKDGAANSSTTHKRKRVSSFSPPSFLPSLKISGANNNGGGGAVPVKDVPPPSIAMANEMGADLDLLAEETNSNSTWSWLEKIM